MGAYMLDIPAYRYVVDSTNIAGISKIGQEIQIWQHTSTKTTVKVTWRFSFYKQASQMKNNVNSSRTNGYAPFKHIKTSIQTCTSMLRTCMVYTANWIGQSRCYQKLTHPYYAHPHHNTPPPSESIILGTH